MRIDIGGMATCIYRPPNRWLRGAQQSISNTKLFNKIPSSSVYISEWHPVISGGACIPTRQCYDLNPSTLFCSPRRDLPQFRPSLRCLYWSIDHAPRDSRRAISPTRNPSGYFHPIKSIYAGVCNSHHYIHIWLSAAHEQSLGCSVCTHHRMQKQSCELGEANSSIPSISTHEMQENQSSRLGVSSEQILVRLGQHYMRRKIQIFRHL